MKRLTALAVLVMLVVPVSTAYAWHLYIQGNSRSFEMPSSDYDYMLRWESNSRMTNMEVPDDLYVDAYLYKNGSYLDQCHGHSPGATWTVYCGTNYDASYHTGSYCVNTLWEVYGYHNFFDQGTDQEELLTGPESGSTSSHDVNPIDKTIDCPPTSTNQPQSPELSRIVGQDVAGYRILSLDEVWDLDQANGFRSLDQKREFVAAVNRFIMPNLPIGSKKPVFGLSRDGNLAIIGVRTSEDVDLTFRLIKGPSGWQVAGR